jgi:hypothetical protein
MCSTKAMMVAITAIAVTPCLDHTTVWITLKAAKHLDHSGLVHTPACRWCWPLGASWSLLYTTAPSPMPLETHCSQETAACRHALLLRQQHKAVASDVPPGRPAAIVASWNLQLLLDRWRQLWAAAQGGLVGVHQKSSCHHGVWSLQLLLLDHTHLRHVLAATLQAPASQGTSRPRITSAGS